LVESRLVCAASEAIEVILRNGLWESLDLHDEHFVGYELHQVKTFLEKIPHPLALVTVQLYKFVGQKSRDLEIPSPDQEHRFKYMESLSGFWIYLQGWVKLDQNKYDPYQIEENQMT
jgi:hypothetical protein